MLFHQQLRTHQQFRATWPTPQLLAFSLCIFGCHIYMKIGLLRGMQLSPHHSTRISCSFTVLSRPTSAICRIFNGIRACNKSFYIGLLSFITKIKILTTGCGAKYMTLYSCRAGIRTWSHTYGQGRCAYCCSWRNTTFWLSYTLYLAYHQRYHGPRNN